MTALQLVARLRDLEPGMNFVVSFAGNQYVFQKN